MSEQPKQEWRIEGTRTGIGSTFCLNGKLFHHVKSASLQVGPAGTRTTLILELVPSHVEVVADPELHLIVGNQRFKVIEDTPEGTLDDGLFRERGASSESL